MIAMDPTKALLLSVQESTTPKKVSAGQSSKKSNENLNEKRVNPFPIWIQARFKTLNKIPIKNA